MKTKQTKLEKKLEELKKYLELVRKLNDLFQDIEFLEDFRAYHPPLFSSYNVILIPSRIRNLEEELEKIYQGLEKIYPGLRKPLVNLLSQKIKRTKRIVKDRMNFLYEESNKLARSYFYIYN